MLKSIPSLLHADALHALRAMGHGDELVLTDANFPSASVAAETHVGEPLQLPGADVIEAGRAILRVLPLDSFVAHQVYRMQVDGAPDEIPGVQAAFAAMAEGAAGQPVSIGAIPRLDFYERAKRAFAVVTTGERRPWGCFILVKGVLKPDGSVWVV